VFDVGNGELRSFSPTHAPRDKMQRFLPPAGEYHDISSLPHLFGARIPTSAYCTLCWRSKHEGFCTKSCTVCDEMTHKGNACPLLYLSNPAWKVRGRNPKANMQLRPTEIELAYLIVAGVFLYKPNMPFWDPLVINKGHPIVLGFYKDGFFPYRLGPAPDSFSIKAYEVYTIPPRVVAPAHAQDDEGDVPTSATLPSLSAATANKAKVKGPPAAPDSDRSLAVQPAAIIGAAEDVSDNRVLMMIIVERVYCSVCDAVS
jgi:hypothetical protein